MQIIISVADNGFIVESKEEGLPVGLRRVHLKAESASSDVEERLQELEFNREMEKQG
jgi:hypothetical protein